MNMNAQKKNLRNVTFRSRQRVSRGIVLACPPGAAAAGAIRSCCCCLSCRTLTTGAEPRRPVCLGRKPSPSKETGRSAGKYNKNYAKMAQIPPFSFLKSGCHELQSGWAAREPLFLRMKEEGQIYKILPCLRIFNFCLGTKLWSKFSDDFIPFFDFQRP